MLTVKTPEEVLEIITSEFKVLEKTTEYVSLWDACGRILNNDISSTEYIPDFNRSMVDGFAVQAADTFGCSDSIPAILSLKGEVLMGEAAMMEVTQGNCVAVPTGGEIPSGADSVVMIEYTEDYKDGTIGVLKSVAPGNNLILRGDDVFPGKSVLNAGRKLTPQDIGALAALGITNVPVQKMLVIGIISTGDELVPVEERPKQGQIRDVNSSILTAIVKNNCATVINYGIIKDQEDLLYQIVENAARECDVVLISGGSSVGMKDATSKIIESLGEILFHGIAMKPGKPTIFGRVNKKPVIGLPGHPVAAFFVTNLFIRPLIDVLNGNHASKHQVNAILTETVSANHGRAQYNGVFLKYDEQKIFAQPIRGKSGLITTLAGSDGYFCIERDCEGISAGTEIQVTLYSKE